MDCLCSLSVVDVSQRHVIMSSLS